MDEKHIALDARFTANSMAIENFTSAIAMKTPQAKKIHIEMALQNASIADQYDMLIQQAGWETQPGATFKEQAYTLQSFQRMGAQSVSYPSVPIV